MCELLPAVGMSRKALIILMRTPRDVCSDMVGLGGLEPPTSRLSVEYSNQLSYSPINPGIPT